MRELTPGFAPQIEQWASLLLEQGWCVIPSLVSPETVRALDADLARDFEGTPFCNGGFYGARTKRFGRLLARSALSKRLVQHPLVLGISRRVLGPWCDTIQLNLTQALALHPGSAAATAAPRPGHVARSDRRDGISGQRHVALHALHARERRHRRLAQEPRQARARSAPARRRVSGGARARVRRCCSLARPSTAPAATPATRCGAERSSATAWDGSSPTRTSGSPTRRRSRAASARNSPPSPATSSTGPTSAIMRASARPCSSTATCLHGLPRRTPSGPIRKSSSPNSCATRIGPRPVRLHEGYAR